LRAALLSSAAALAAPSAAAGAAPRFVVAPERFAAAPYAQWAHAHFVWKEDSPNATQCAALVESYLARNISVGGLDVDSGWSTGYDNFVVTPAFGDLAGLTARMHALDVRVIMWATALVNTDSPNFAEGQAKGFFLRDALNETALVSWWHGRGAFLDYGNADALALSLSFGLTDVLAALHVLKMQPDTAGVPLLVVGEPDAVAWADTQARQVATWRASLAASLRTSCRLPISPLRSLYSSSVSLAS
jgi:hypothetical protein